MQINVMNVRVTTFDKAFMTIGPSIQNVVRGRQNQNQGFGEVEGDFNTTETTRFEVDDRDGIDFPVHRVHINIAGKRK
ncbi:hypothetical protein [Tumebacillus sp. BK434]|uniref:hypothetical protein n=1 Tax=Tumebacillus sp. BK434 TaxID=2512169 RepID=UPI00104BC721|nr:hypothetical protein [Tumebacillus sp. BK434]